MALSARADAPTSGICRMWAAPIQADTGAMVIRIRLETQDPPTGTVALEDALEAPSAFVGWLGLLRALSELFAAGPE
jgi:hypothetical protein